MNRAERRIMILVGISAVGQGTRMVVESIKADSVYVPGIGFDLFFDWLPLAILGGVAMVLGIRSYYAERVAAQRAGSVTA